MVLTKNEQAMLLYLFKHTLEEFSINQLARRIHISSRGAFKILQKFEREGILVKRTVANAVIHALHFDDHKTEDLIKFSLKSEAVPNDYMQLLRNELELLKKCTNALVVFGSVLHEGSHAKFIDILLLTENQHHASEMLVEFQKRTGKVFRLHDEEKLLEIINHGYILWGYDYIYQKVKSIFKKKNYGETKVSIDKPIELSPPTKIAALNETKSSESVNVTDSESVNVTDSKAVNVIGSKSAVSSSPAIDTKKDITFATRYLTLIENLKDMIFSLDLDGKFTYVNRSEIDLLGYLPEELLDKPFLFIVSANSRNIFKDYLSQALKSFRVTGPVDLEIELRSKDYLIKTFQLTISLQKTDGVPSYFLGIGRDITEQKRLLAQKEEAELSIRSYMQAVLDNVPSAIVVLDDGLRCTFANKTFYDFFHGKKIVGQAMVQFLPISLITKHRVELKTRQALLLKKDIINLEFEHKGNYYSADIILADIGSKYESIPISSILIINDITVKKKAELDEMERIKHREELLSLQKVDRLKTDFLNVTSHELKTPLTPTLIQAQLLDENALGELNEEQKKSVNIIIRNMKQLELLINDVLDISRIQSGTLKLESSKSSLSELVKQVSETLKLQAGSRNILLSAKVSPMPTISYDDGRVRQVLRNLVNNAIKFTPPGGEILITAKKKGKFLQVDVKDTGRGITKLNLSKVFQPFFQVKLSYKIKEKGRGLGLSICKGIIEAHGGKIWADSVVGKGTTFHFTLPIKQEKLSEKQVSSDVPGLFNLG
jgi:PAS domain S-box-containing protein